MKSHISEGVYAAIPLLLIPLGAWRHDLQEAVSVRGKLFCDDHTGGVIRGHQPRVHLVEVIVEPDPPFVFGDSRISGETRDRMEESHFLECGQNGGVEQHLLGNFSDVRGVYFRLCVRGAKR